MIEVVLARADKFPGETGVEEMSKQESTGYEVTAGGSTTPQELGEQPLAERGSKSSDAASANTPTSVTRSNFAARVARTQLSTGATLLVLENHATATISLRGSLRAGSYFEPRDKPGLASITADMLERGTRRRTKLQLANDLESVGAEIEFSTDSFSIEVAGRALAKDLSLLINTLAETLREPAFPAAELEKLKQQAIAAIQEQQANTRLRAYEKFSQLTYDPANPFYVHAGDALVKSLNSITVEDVQRFYDERYGGRSLVLAVVGDVRADEVQRLFAKAFDEFTGPRQSVEINVDDPEPPTETRREIVFLREKANVDVLLGASAPLRRAAGDYYAATLSNGALGQSTLSSRLGLQVRDREGLTYGIGSRFRAPSLAAGPWYIAVSVNPTNVEKAIGSALAVLNDYVTNGMTAAELADEKSSAIGSFKVSLSTNAGIAEALWNAEFFELGLDYMDRFPELIGVVTLAEANAAIRKYFRPAQLTIVIAGDYEATPAGSVPIT